MKANNYEATTSSIAYQAPDLSKDAILGVKALAQDLAISFEEKTKRCTVAALIALETCTSPEERRGVVKAYSCTLRQIAADLATQATAQLEGHIDKIAPLEECTIGKNLII